jgi:hypothetical protein
MPIDAGCLVSTHQGRSTAGSVPDPMAAMRPSLRAPATPSRRPWSPLSIDRNFQTVILACGLGLTAEVGFLIHPTANLSTLMSVEAAGDACARTASMSATWP